MHWTVVMLKGRALTVALLTGVVLIGCGKPPETVVAPRMVKAFVVGQSVESDPASGAITMPSAVARDPAALAFDAAGRVIALMAAVGDQVQAGQALARLDPRDLALSESSAKTQFDAAHAELDFAESDFKRYADLFARGFISKAELDRRKAQLQLSRAKFESTAEQLGFISLRAIEPGTVQAVLIAPGLMVQARQVAIMIKLSAPSAARKQPQRPAGLLIPLSALIDGRAVYKIVGQGDATKTLQKVEVRLGQVTEATAEVLSGLAQGDQIVAAGVHALNDGDKVRLFSQ